MMDPWLDSWLTLVRERAGTTRVLELGCGHGRDTASLVAAGLHVVAVDRSSDAIESARAEIPGVEFYVGDIREPFPLRNTRVVIASLSLHYFAWSETVAIVERIHSTLDERGVLICRLNSTNDLHFGASGFPRIEDDYYLVDGQPKRFFNKTALERLFATGWRMLFVEERTIRRYDHPKVVWEMVVEKTSAT